MHDTVRVDVDELSKAIARVVWPNEPALDTCCFPLCAQRLRVGDVNVHDAPGPSTVVWVLCDEVQLHRTPLDEAILRGLVQFGCKAQASISRECSVEVVHGNDGSDALEDDLSHDEKKVDRRRTASNRKLLWMRPSTALEGRPYLALTDGFLTQGLPTASSYFRHNPALAMTQSALESRN